ncbi:MAG: hypothetical protein WCI04_02725 [archaeon]
MELGDFTQKPCRSKMAYEFLPKKNVKVDLEKAAEEITKVGTIEIRSKVLLMVKIDEKIVSLFPSGKILVRGERDENTAKNIAKKAVQTLKNSTK